MAVHSGRLSRGCRLSVLGLRQLARTEPAAARNGASPRVGTKLFSTEATDVDSREDILCKAGANELGGCWTKEVVNRAGHTH